MNRRMKLGIWLALLLLLAVFPANRAYALAGTGTEYITISVNASDDNEQLQYAIDEPVNFSYQNTFTIPAGTSHTIYVKDAAGNITSQEYSASGSGTVVSSGSGTANSSATDTYGITAGSGDQEINIELELGMNTDGIGTGGAAFGGDYKNYEYLTDSVVETPATTVQSKTTTDGSDTAQKVFYDFVTAEGETFYLVIDQGSSNAVHFLNTVTLEDLKAIAAANADSSTSAASAPEKEDNLLEALKNNEAGGEAGPTDKTSGEKSNNDMLLLLILVGIAGGAYYYFKVYKNKKNETMDAMDAMDMDEFQLEEEEDDEEIEFDDEEKQQMLDELIASNEYSEENELYNADPEEYDTDPEEYDAVPEVENGDDEISEALSAAMEYDDELDGEED